MHSCVHTTRYRPRCRARSAHCCAHRTRGRELCRTPEALCRARLGHPSRKPCCDTKSLSRHKLKQTLSRKRILWQERKPSGSCHDRKPSVATGKLWEIYRDREFSIGTKFICHACWCVHVVLSCRDTMPFGLSHTLSRHNFFVATRSQGNYVSTRKTSVVTHSRPVPTTTQLRHKNPVTTRGRGFQ